MITLEVDIVYNQIERGTIYENPEIIQWCTSVKLPKFEWTKSKQSMYLHNDKWSWWQQNLKSCHIPLFVYQDTGKL